MERIRILFVGDGVAATGFARVLHSIAKFLHQKDEYKISWLAVNYNGDPHEYPYRIYMAKTPNGPYGIDKLQYVCDKEKPQIIFMLNDAWVLDPYLARIKEIYTPENRPKIVTYSPVDAKDHDKSWYKNFDIVDKVVLYTEFGKQVVKESVPELETIIIPHGIDTDDFYKVAMTTREVKKLVFPNREDLIDSFIVLSANRNQPRKRLDLTMQGFKLFAEDKPENVKLYMHCGVVDASMNITLLSERYGLDKRLIITSNSKGIQKVSVERLNLLYNATDVGINTGLGEGWGLTSIEHAVTGAPQVVADHSALHELYEDCGVLIPAKIPFVLDNICTTGYMVTAEDVAESLNKLYNDVNLYNDLSRKGFRKFTQEKYSWKSITESWHSVFLEVLNK